MKRDLSIDLLKFLAVFFVVNSHMDMCYPGGLRFLASGGAIGDALFFFCSGFTLFIGRDDGFIPWYKRRLARIMPAVIVCVLAYACAYGEGWYEAVGGYWFVRCILLYYVLLYEDICCAVSGCRLLSQRWFHSAGGFWVDQRTGVLMAVIALCGRCISS